MNFHRLSLYQTVTLKKCTRWYVCVCVWGGGGCSKTFYTGRLRCEVQPLTLLWTIFDRLTKKYPFCIPSIIASLELCIPFNCCKLNALSLKQWINVKMRERFSRIFLSQKMNLLAFLSLFTNQNGRFLYSFISVIPNLSQIHIAEVRKSYPFRSDLLVYVIIRSAPTGMHYT